MEWPSQSRLGGSVNVAQPFVFLPLCIYLMFCIFVRLFNYCVVFCCRAIASDVDVQKKQKLSSEADIMNCPVCFNFMCPPVYQCTQGHPICASCSPQIDTCPQCRVSMSIKIRCLLVEQLLEREMFDCQYRSSGCSEKVKYSEKSTHEGKCPMRPFQCPHRCSLKYSGSDKDLIEHLKTDHQDRIRVAYLRLLGCHQSWNQICKRYQ